MTPVAAGREEVMFEGFALDWVDVGDAELRVWGAGGPAPIYGVRRSSLPGGVCRRLRDS